MIKRSFAFLAVLVFLASTGCSKIGDLFTVSVDADFTVDLPVSIAGPDMKTGSYAFDVTKTINLADEPDLVDYIDKIKGISLSTMSSTVMGLALVIQLLDATLTFSGNGESVSWSFTNLSIQNGTALVLANNAGQFDTVSTILEGLGDVVVRFSGNSNMNNVEYTLTNVLSAAVKAGL